MTTIGAYIKAKRKESELSLEELAELTATGTAVLEQIESGDLHQMGDGFLSAVADVFGVDVADLTAMLPKPKPAMESHVRESLTLEAELQAPDNQTMTGREWEVVIIGATADRPTVKEAGREFVVSRNGRLYDVKALRESVPLWEGVKVYDNHLTQAEYEAKQGMRSPAKEWLGVIVSPRWDENRKQLRGRFKVVENALAEKLKNAYEAGVLSAIGLSIDTFPIMGTPVVYEGQQIPVIEGFKKILSVDLVGDPAAGGGFDRIVASVTQYQQGETSMDPENQVQEAEETAVDEKLVAAVADAIRPTIVKTVNSTLAEALAADVEEIEEAESVTDEGQDNQPDAQAKEAIAEARIARCELVLERRLSKAKLPDKLESMVRRQYEGKIFETADLDGTIQAAKEAHAAMDKTGQVQESNGKRPDISVGLDKEDKYAIELTRIIMGDREFSKLAEAKPGDMVYDRVREANYLQDWERNGRPVFESRFRPMSNLIWEWFGGDLLSDPRAQEAATTSTLSSVVKNALNVMVAAEYSKRERWYEPLVTTEEVDTIDQATLARVYGTSSLSVVNEGAAYTELALADDEETAAFVKKGNYVGLPIEVIMRDKINYIRRIPALLANSWYNTLSDLVAGVFTVNTATGPALSDTGALFNATAVSTAGGHANLLTTALSFSAFSAARTAMLKQTDQTLGNGRKLLIEPRYLLVPVDLETTALQIRNSEQQPGVGNNDANPFYQKFDVVKVPSWTDTNNWALVGDPGMFPAIYLIFPRGQRAPQIFTADSETSGSMFTNDSLRFKVRMMTYRFSSTYDCAPVADFRPLHKSNVA